jgi:hypothetical protein
LQQELPVETHISSVIQLLEQTFALTFWGRLMRVAAVAMLLFLGPSVFALAEDGRRVPPSDSASSASSSSTNALSTKKSPAASASPTANALLAVTLPNAPTAEVGGTEFRDTELKTAEPPTAGTLAPAATEPALGAEFLLNNNLASIHALVAPPAALIKLRTPPRTHSFFDARNTLGFATLGASLTADALSTQKGLAYPGFVEMNPIARPFVQSRLGAAVYNAGSFGLMAGLMYWAHKKEHHKLERILPLAVGSWEGLLSARNYHVIANRK